MEDYQGEVLDSRYLVEEMIGKGGMGVVYRGKHIVVGREVAIKFLSSEFATQKDVVTRFYREAQTAAAIGHKNIIDILDVGISDRHEPYFVMEYLEGECLSSLLSRSVALDLGAACGILEPVLLAVSAAHSKGIVHRDLKPENIFLVHDPVDDSITIKLIDFGISKFLNITENEKLTVAGSALGTPCYMSPEQVSCALDIDHRSDIYSIGVLFYEMLTKDTPHTGGSNQELMLKILTEPPRNPSDINPSFPEEARAIIERAMASRPQDRYLNGVEMLEDLRRLSVFPERRRRLSEYALGISARQCAVGDLGRTIGEDENEEVPAKVLTELSEHYTPDMWTHSRHKLSRFPAGPKERILWMVAGGGVVVLAIILFVLQGSGSGHATEAFDVQNIPIQSPAPVDETPPSPSNTATVAKREIRVAIGDLPSRATIVYDGVLVPSNKFYVPAGEEAVSLVVEAPGFEPFTTDIVPDRDLDVRVEMTPRTTGSRRSKTAASRAETSDDVTEDERYIRGRRKTEIVKDFE